MKRAFSDLVVVELAGDISGAYAAKLFADFGADVVKVEQPGGSAIRDRVAPGVGGTRGRVSGTHLHVDTNKRGIIVDPSVPDDIAGLWALVGRADLVIESSGPGTLGAYDLDWEVVHARVPHVVLTTVTGFGTTGPYAHYASSDLVAQAFAGMLTMLDGRPLKLPAELASCIVATAAAAGSLGSVWLSRASGRRVARRLRGLRDTPHDTVSGNIASCLLLPGSRALSGGGRLAGKSDPLGDLPLCRRLGEPVHDATADRPHARHPRRRWAARGVRRPRRADQRGDARGSRRGVLSLAALSHGDRGDRRGAASRLVVRAVQLSRRGRRSRSSPPARFLGPCRPPRGRRGRSARTTLQAG